MTFSIVACSEDRAIWGVAVASKVLAVGASVPGVWTGIGAVASQSVEDASMRWAALSLVARYEASAALELLLGRCPDRDRRQLGLVDAAGRPVSYTGTQCPSWAGSITDGSCALQGNRLTDAAVLEAMHRSWLASSSGHPPSPLPLPFGRRLVAALRAGDAAGGDGRGRQSAALLVSPRAGAGGRSGAVVDLRVDDHPDPCRELSRLLDLRAAADRVLA